MIEVESQLSLSKQLDFYWYGDSSLPQLIDKSVLDDELSFFKETFMPDLKKTAAEIKALKKEIKYCKKESETCTKIITPLLKILGYYEKNSYLFDEQRAFKLDGLKYIPDYSFFANKEDHDAASKLEGQEYYKHIELILEAKRYGKDLLLKTKVNKTLDRVSDSLGGITPVSQTKRYLRLSNTKYGISTNGDDWILHAIDGTNDLSSYHVKIFDLVELCEVHNNYDPLLYWLIPFSKQYILDKRGSGLQNLIEETSRVTNSVESDLKDRLVPVVLDLLNLNLKKKRSITQEESIVEAVRFIYIIMYIGCLEDRNLLPMGDSLYRDKYSIKNLFKTLISPECDFRINKNSKLIVGFLKSTIEAVESGCYESDRSTSSFLIGQSLDLPEIANLRDNDLKSILCKMLIGRSNKEIMMSLRSLDTVQFGNIYESLLKLDIGFQDGEFFIKNDKDAKFERTTAVYTPHRIVDKMVSKSIERIDIKTWDDVKSCTFIDPCFGSGHFLIEFSRQFSQKIIDSLDVSEIDLPDKDEMKSSVELRTSIQRFLFENVIFGIDRGEACLEVAKFAIWLSCPAIKKPPVYIQNQIRVGNSLYGETDLNKLESSTMMRRLKEIATFRCSIKKILNGKASSKRKSSRIKALEKKIEAKKSSFDSDSLLQLKFGYDVDKNKAINLEERQKPFFWLKEFPEVFLAGGFKVYITNPPYDQLKSSPKTGEFILGESEKYRLAKMTSLDIEDAKELFDNDPYYSPYQKGYKNLFEGFVLLKNKLLNKQGVFSFIVPNSILAGEQTYLVRENLWRSSMFLVEEYPEKDSVKKRVFKNRKQACCIIYGDLSKNIKSLDLKIYADYSISKPSVEGCIDFVKSKAVDEKNKPIVVLDEWQSIISESFSNLSTVSFEPKMFNEGELNESFNKGKIKEDFCDGMTSIYGTNRLNKFYFNSFPKQDLINYCDLTEVDISSEKRKHIDFPRIAINGIAGVNDTKIISSSFLPPGILINSNVNYILESSIEKMTYDSRIFITVINSTVFDHILRVQKRTSHNSNFLLSTLKFPNFDLNTIVDEDAIMNQRKMNLDNLISEGGELSSDFFLYLQKNHDLSLYAGILKNESISAFTDSLFSLADFSNDEKNKISRSCHNGSLDFEDLFVKCSFKGKTLKKLRSDYKVMSKEVGVCKQAEKMLLYYVDYYLSAVFLGEESLDFLKAKNVKQEKFESLYNISSSLEGLGVEPVDGYLLWHNYIAA